MSKSPKTFESKKGQVKTADLAQLRILVYYFLQVLEDNHIKFRTDITTLEVTSADHEARLVVLEP